jgi:hypothetical protein
MGRKQPSLTNQEPSPKGLGFWVCLASLVRPSASLARSESLTSVRLRLSFASPKKQRSLRSLKVEQASRLRRLLRNGYAISLSGSLRSLESIAPQCNKNGFSEKTVFFVGGNLAECLAECLPTTIV